MKLFQLIVTLFLTVQSIPNGICQGNLSNKQIAKLYIEEVVNNRKLELLDEIFADSFIVHFLADGTETQGTITTHRDFLEYLIRAFPDLHYIIGDILENDDKVAMRVVLTGTHKNEFWGQEATGNRIDYFSEIFFYRFVNKKISECWVQTDLCTFFKKLNE